MTRPEILAPAGSFDSLIAGVRSGANAVYLGASGFNARANAVNFDAEGLKEAVRYCHQRGVKVYQTLNTLVFDREIPALIEQIKASAKAGVDALIVQDLGVVAIAKAIAPQLELHASTQMSIMNQQGLAIAKEMGLTRAVLARELTFEEIDAIRLDGIEREVFIHGALCMSVSGQCYMSVTLGGRSGNRGQCAQPCRLPFAAEGGFSHGLSLRDLSLVEQMQKLCALDVASLKIEGRMKRPEYVAAAVTACRMALEGQQPDMELLEGVFSRSGFTSGYFDNQIDKAMFGIRTKEDVLAATDALKKAEQLYREEYPAIGLDITFTMEVDKLPVLTITDCDGNSVSVTGQEPVQEARSKPTDEERVAQSLGKLGGTPYFIKELRCTLSPNGMLPVSQLNALRRDAIEQLDALRSAVGAPMLSDYTPKAEPKPDPKRSPALRARILSINQIAPKLTEACQTITMPYGALLGAVASGKLPADKCVMELPRILFPSEHGDIHEVIDKLKAAGVDKAWCGNIGAIHIARSHGLQIIGGFSLNATNSEAVSALQALGVSETELSIELPLADARSISSAMPLGLVAYGYLPSMTFRNCPIKAAMGCEGCGRGFHTLTDRMGEQFAVDCGTGTPELFNCVPLYLADRMQELKGFDFVSLYFTSESRSEVDTAIEAYQKGLPMEGSKTRGIYYRGLTE